MPQIVTSRPASYSPGAAWNIQASASAGATGLLPAGPSCQPCPECGGLECLCRPRFFAGQLLTEQDLNRLEQYIIAKNRLHNRYLVGHGVVCGLEVRCHPCGNLVTVSPGYAINGCGDDIIVCSQDTVDICTLIKACTPSVQPDCSPYRTTADCPDVEQEWILAIRYAEAPSRGVTPLTGSAQCACGCPAGTCSCGAGAVKPCGCPGIMPAGCCGETMTSAAPVSTNRPRRGAPPACEPTVTCEAYRYEVFPAPPQIAPPPPAPVRGLAGLASTIGGDLFARLACCLQDLIALFPPTPTSPPDTPAGKTEWSNFCCNLRQALIQYLLAHGGTDCQAITKLHAAVCPSPSIQDNNTFIQELALALEIEVLVFFEIVVGCFCSAALPPCPPPGDPRVPLASVRVRVSDCGIVSICDWTPLRKHVVTVKTLGYWLGWLPYGGIIRQFLQVACCNLFNLPQQIGVPAPRPPAPPPAPPAPPGPAVEAGAGVNAATSGGGGSQGADKPIVFGPPSYRTPRPFAEAVTANLVGPPNSINFTTLLNALLEPIDPGAPGQEGVPQRLTASPHAKVVAEIARPLVSSLLGPLAGSAIGGAGPPAPALMEVVRPLLSDLLGPLIGGVSPPPQPPEAPTAADLTALRQELDQLRQTVAAQQSDLETLRRPQGNP
jgi:hypothetical protein